jgi:hypothetical protein
MSIEIQGGRPGQLSVPGQHTRLVDVQDLARRADAAIELRTDADSNTSEYQTPQREYDRTPSPSSPQGPSENTGPTSWPTWQNQGNVFVNPEAAVKRGV